MIVDVIHVRCGGVAFRYSEVPRKGDVFPVVAKLVGSEMRRGDLITCGNCGERMLEFKLSSDGTHVEGA